MEENIAPKRRLAIVGSRDFTDYEKFCKMVAFVDKEYGILKDVDEIVSGHGDGTDLMAERFADEKGYKKVIYPPNWSKYGKKAGPIRNNLIVQRMTHMLALPRIIEGAYSKGTKDSIDKAVEACKRCYIIAIEL